MILVRNLRLALDEGQDLLEERLRRRLRWPAGQALPFEIYRESIDSRKGRPTSLVYQLLVDVDADHPHIRPFLKDAKNYSRYEPLSFQPEPGETPLRSRPVVIGAGPAGLFAALQLAESGYRPIVIERGEPVEARVQSVEQFWAGGPLNPWSNVQFGEGGAGTFSDGKLTSRSKDPRSHKVLETFVEAGAPVDILYKQLPHIGSDVLRYVTITLRKRIEAAGGSFCFNRTLVDVVPRERGAILHMEDPQGEETSLEAEAVILAIGHSARQTFRMLHGREVAMAAKPFAVGLRIEHPQTFIDRTQYGDDAGHPRLEAAPYKLAVPAGDDHQAYSFCMCPGGMVVAASSEANRLVVNGMSYHARDLMNANSAILTGVNERDVGGDVLAGLALQEALEERAYALGGGGFRAPVMTPEAFLGGSMDPVNAIIPSYRPGVKDADLRTIFPTAIVRRLQEGLRQMELRMPGFVQGQGWKPILTAVESRSSSPLRIDRDPETLMSPSHPGLYPCGEGAGYAGGIVSSAIDGLRVAESIIQTFTRPL